jgi:hypothetical protein
MAGVDQRILEIILRAKDETQKGLASASKNIDGAQANMGMVAGGAAAVGAGVAIAAALNSAGDAAAAYGSQVLTVQRLTGASAEESSKWAAILGRYGVDATGAGRIIKSLDTAIVGQSKALKAAGIATQDASGHNRSAQAVLADLAQYYSTATDKTAATALAAKVLGKGYLSLLPILANGKAGIDDITASAERNGLILSQDQVNACKAYNAAVKDNEESAKGLTVQLGLMMLPLKTLAEKWLAGVLQWFNKLSPEMKNFVGMGAAITAGVLVFGGALTMLAGVLPTIVAGFGLLTAALSAESIAAGIAWVATLGPIALVIAGIALVAGAVYLVVANWSKITAFFGKLWAGLKAFFAKWGTEILAVMVPFIGVPLLIAKHWDVIGPFLKKMWDGAVAFCKKGIDTIVGFIASLPQRALDALKNLGAMIMGPVTEALKVLGNLNPFQRHSPSLVDNVIAGAAEIAKHYGKLGGMKIGAPVIGGMPSVAYAGAGSFGGSGASAGSVNARLLAVLERLERNGVVTNLDGNKVSRALGIVTTDAGRTGRR